MKLLSASIALFLFTTAFTILDASSWDVKNKAYTIKFSTSGATGTIEGLDGEIAFDKDKLPESNFKVSVAVKTLDTGSKMKNKHAKASSFLDVENHPTIVFESSSVEANDKGFVAAGNLTIKGISKEVEIPFEFEQEADNATFKGAFQINLPDFDLKKMGVGKTLDIEMQIPVSKKG